MVKLLIFLLLLYFLLFNGVSEFIFFFNFGFFFLVVAHVIVHGQHCLNQINQFPDQLPCSLNQTVRGKALKYNLIGARALLELNPRFIQPIDLVCKNQQ